MGLGKLMLVVGLWAWDAVDGWRASLAGSLLEEACDGCVMRTTALEDIFEALYCQIIL